MVFRCKKQRSLSVLLAAALLSTVSAADEQKERAKLPTELEPLFAMAMAAPPEFAARALLNLNSRVPDKKLRQEFLEMAFRLAPKAQYPVRLIAFPGSEVNTRSGSTSNALQLKLDTLSLQSRAVQETIAADPRHGRELFETMARPALSVVGCEGTLIPDVAPYWETLTTVTKKAFSAAEQSKGDHLTLAVAALGRVTSLVEIAPAARMVSLVEWSPAQFKNAISTFATKLEAVPVDARSFLYFSKVIDSEMVVLVERARKLGAAPEPLIESYRKFLLAEFHGQHCADAGNHVSQLVQQTALFGESIRGNRPPISNEEMVHALFEGEMRIDRYWQTPESETMFRTFLKLQHGPDIDILADPSTRASEWTRQLTAFLNAFGTRLSGDEQSERDYFHERAIVYEALVQELPPGEVRNRVVDDFVNMVKSSNLQRRNTVEWFWRAQSMVNQLRGKHPAEAAKVLAAYKGSGNIVLVLESMLDQGTGGTQ